MTPTPRANHDDLVAFLAHDDLGGDETRRAELEAALDLAVEGAVAAYPEPDASPCFEDDLFRRLDALETPQAPASRVPRLRLLQQGLVALAACGLMAVSLPSMPLQGGPAEADLYDNREMLEELDVLLDLEVIEALEDNREG